MATIPLDQERSCTAAFLYALCFLVLQQQFSTGLGQRVRGTYRPDQDTLPIPSRLTTLPYMKIVGSILNVVFIYKLLKKFSSFRYVVSFTRVQSRITGYICKLYVPHIFRAPYFGLFAYMYGVKIEEAERDDFRMYDTFTDFFTRTLKPGSRPIFKPDDATSITSPCDGRVLTVGQVSSADSTIDCVKGRSYRLDEFMLGYIGDPEDPTDNVTKIENSKNNPSVQALLDNVKAKGNELYYMVIYLSPGDYHRFHSPAIHTADYRRHIAGYLAPVKPSYVNKHKDVFKNNERVNIFGEWRGEEKDFFFTSFVGALNVGSILLDFDEDVQTNQACPANPYYEDKIYNSEVSSPLSRYESSPKSSEGQISFEKGEMTGRFEMGSTIALIYEAPPSTTKTLIKEGDKVTLGQPLILTDELNSLIDDGDYVRSNWSMLQKDISVSN